MKRVIIIFLTALFPIISISAKDSKTNEKEARELFNKIYDLVFGEQGSSLSYSVNIIGLYKTSGTIMYKGNKVHYKESRYSAWEDGITAYMVDAKKKTVDIYDHNDDKKDEYLSKFKYDVNNFIFNYKTEGNHYIITAKIKDSSFFGIREVKAKIIKSNLHPVSMTIKLAIFSTTVKISNFKSGNIDDSNFTFPKKDFTKYKFTDHRKSSQK